MKRLTILSMLAILPSLAYGSPFTLGNLVVVQSGTNGNTVGLNGNTTAAALREYTTGGGLVQQIDIPTVASGANNAFTISGSATTEGFIARSTDGNYLTLGGYNLGVAATTGNGAAGNVNNRVIARVDASGNVDTSTSITNIGTTGNIRSVVTDNGSRYWASTSSSGLNYVSTHGVQNSTTNMHSGLGSGPSNVRVSRIFNGQLYSDSQSGSFQGIMTNGIGLPPGPNGVVSGILPGMPIAAGPSYYGFFMYDSNGDTVLDIAYLADDRTILNGALTTANGGGIHKWTFNGSAWSLAYVLGTNITVTAGNNFGIRGLAVDVSGSTPILYATTGESNTNRLISLIDTGALAVPTTLATAGLNTAFRGLDFAPGVVPEPTAAVLGGLGLLAMLHFRRSRR